MYLTHGTCLHMCSICVISICGKLKFFGQSQTMVFVGMYATAAHANFVLGITCQVPDNFSIDKQNTRFADKKLINNK